MTDARLAPPAGSPPGRFIGYPTNRILAVMEDPNRITSLLTALTFAGLSGEAAEILCCEEGLRRLDPTGQAHGPFAELLRLVQFVGEERQLFERYARALAAGKLVVSVLCHDSRVKQRARALLRAHGGTFLHFYGVWAIEPL